MNPENLIAMAACMFGAVSLFATSLIGMNKKWIKQDKTEVTKFEVLNGGIIVLSGGIIALTTIKGFRCMLRVQQKQIKPMI